MEWTMQPAQEDIAPLASPNDDRERAVWREHQLAHPLPEGTMLIFRMSLPLSGGLENDRAMFWWLRPHTEYVQREWGWVAIDTLTGAVRSKKTRPQRLVRKGERAPNLTIGLAASAQSIERAPVPALPIKQPPDGQWTPREVPMALRTPRDGATGGGTPRAY